MSSFKTRAIVLRRKTFSESDRMLTVYTDTHGKLRILAKGVRKPTSKLAGHLELFCLSKLNIAEGRNFGIITSAQTDKCYWNIRNDEKVANTAHYLAEIVDQLTVEDESHPKIFKLLESALDSIGTIDSQLILPYFELNIAKEIGLIPELYVCLDCGKKIEPGSNVFDLEKGGVVCANCKKTHLGKPITDEAIKIMRLLLTYDISVLTKIKASIAGQKEVAAISANYIEHIHQQTFKSKRFIK